MRAIAQQWSLQHLLSMKFVKSKSLKRARGLRRNQTEAEKRLWNQLRNRRLHGFKFDRQVPIGQYIVDFLCHEEKLNVEVDGATHGDAHEVDYDEKRTAFLERMGYRVLRCLNVDVFENLVGVLHTVLLKIRES